MPHGKIIYQLNQSAETVLRARNNNESESPLGIPRNLEMGPVLSLEKYGMGV